MRKTASALVLLAAASGCMTSGNGTYMGHAFNKNGEKPMCGGDTPSAVAGVEGPWGQPVVKHTANKNGAGVASTMDAAKGPTKPIPLVERVSHSEPAPGIGSGACLNGNCQVAMMNQGPGMPYAGGLAGPGGFPPGAVAAAGALTGAPAGPFMAQRTEIRFVDQKGMKVAWYTGAGDGKGGFTATSLDVPGKYNFVQGAVYRLKLTDVPGYPGIPYFPTLEIVPANHKTAAFLAHSAVPVSFTQEDFEQVRAGNYVVKVIYLPDPQYQDLAATGPDEVVSSRLEPGVDPIAEACRRGSILAIVRIGNIDLELEHSPPMYAPSAFPRQMERIPAPGSKGVKPAATDSPNLLPMPPQNLPPVLPAAPAPADGKFNKLSMAPDTGAYTGSSYATLPTTPAELANQSQTPAGWSGKSSFRNRAGSSQYGN